MIKQAYVSESVADFPFREKFNLGSYSNINEPSIFFGMYRNEDIIAVKKHKGMKVIYWCGHDCLDNSMESYSDCYHITPLPKVKKHFDRINKSCILIKPPPVAGNVLAKGTSIYVYCPRGAQSYHRKDIIDSLEINYPMIIGEGIISQKNWPLVSDDFYSKCFLGLVLNPHAGGGSTICELGVRGIRVVTNVFSLPHCIAWNKIEDIEMAIEIESKEIGKKDIILSNQVKECFDYEYEFLKLSFYEST